MKCMDQMPNPIDNPAVINQTSRADRFGAARTRAIRSNAV